MRVMLVSNIAVDQRFANGTQGRLLFWTPGKTDTRKPIYASHPGLQARFCKEKSMQTRTALLPEIDFIDVQVRPESLACAGDPVMLQLPVQPSYALTVHKTQSLSITHVVRGLLEGVFAIGQVYVLISRVTEPRNLEFVGLPPADMLEEVEQAWIDAGFNKDECWKRACSVSNEWIYTPGPGPVSGRISQRRIATRTIPLVHRTLAEVLNPMPRAAVVIGRLLAWIDRVDAASRTCAPKPAFQTEDGSPIFDEDWWLTDQQRRNPPKVAEDPMNEDGPSDSEAGDDAPAADAPASDSDPMSGDEHGEGAIPEGAFTGPAFGSKRRLNRQSRIGWRRT